MVENSSWLPTDRTTTNMLFLMYVATGTWSKTARYARRVGSCGSSEAFAPKTSSLVLFSDARSCQTNGPTVMPSTKSNNR